MGFESVFPSNRQQKRRGIIGMTVWSNGQCRIDKAITGNLPGVYIEIDAPARRVRVRADKEGDRRLSSINRVHLPKVPCLELCGGERKVVIELEPDKFANKEGKLVTWYWGKY